MWGMDCYTRVAVNAALSRAPSFAGDDADARSRRELFFSKLLMPAVHTMGVDGWDLAAATRKVRANAAARGNEGVVAGCDCVLRAIHEVDEANIDTVPPPKPPKGQRAAAAVLAREPRAKRRTRRRARAFHRASRSKNRWVRTCSSPRTRAGPSPRNTPSSASRRLRRSWARGGRNSAPTFAPRTTRARRRRSGNTKRWICRRRSKRRRRRRRRRSRRRRRRSRRRRRNAPRKKPPRRRRRRRCERREKNACAAAADTKATSEATKSEVKSEATKSEVKSEATSPPTSPPARRRRRRV